MKHPSNQSGFALVEAILLIVILAMVGFTGWFVWHSKQATNASLNAASKSSKSTVAKTSTKAAPKSTTTDTTVKLSKYTLKNHGTSFQYPSSWTLKDSSTGTNDLVELTAPSGFTAEISCSNLGRPSADYVPTILFTKTIKNTSLSSGDTYLDFIASTTNANLVQSFNYSQSATDAFDVFQPGGSNLFLTGQSKTPESVTAAKADADYSAAAQLAASIVLGA